MTDVISLGIGEPDFSTPPSIRAAAIRSIVEGLAGYTSNYGIHPLRRAISEYVRRSHGVEYDPNTEISPGPRGSCDRDRIPQLIEIVSGKRVALPPEATRCEGTLHEHHWITRRDGGPNTRENLVPLCEKHHRMVHRILDIYGRAELEPVRAGDQERWGTITTASKVRPDNDLRRAMVSIV